MTKYVRTMDVIPVIVNIVVKVLFINTVTKRCRRCRPRNIPSGWKKKQGKEAENERHQRQKKLQMQLVDEDVSAVLLALKKN